MPDLPDLAALREALVSLAFVRPEIGRAYLIRRELRTTVMREGLAVLALVDTLQGENERLRGALEPFAEFGGHAVEADSEGYGHWLLNHGNERISDWLGPSAFLNAHAALSVSPAEKEEA